MNLLAFCLISTFVMGEIDAPQSQPAPQAPGVTFAPDCSSKLFGCCDSRPMFLSDHDFDSFIGPITNPILSKDPRSNTYVRPMFINNHIPGDHALGAGSGQIYAMQVNIALTERLSLIADKDGIARIDSDGGIHDSGWLNLAAGLKYTFWRDVECQTIAAAGFMFEAPWGEESVFQGRGSGVFTSFITGGQKIGENIHVLNTFGYQFAANTHYNSNFFYDSFHIDYGICGWLYPLAELNWFHYTKGGDQLPSFVGEGDGLLNLGTNGVEGNNLVTVAFGAKAKVSCNIEVGAAWEFPITGRKDLIENRLVTELILRY